MFFALVEITDNIPEDRNPLVDALERRLIRRAVDQTNGNISKAARLLGLSRNELVMKIGRLGIR